jgi:peptide/nickel transport system ATP-binding protein
MIAMALCASPQLLIADEPTTALDVTVQQAILELIKELARELGVAIIFISHDLAVVRRIANRVLIMRTGKVVEHGPVESVFKHPKAAYTKGLLACHPPLDKRVKRLATVSDFTDKEDIDHQAFLASLTEPEGDWQKRQDKLAEASVILQMKAIQVWYTKNRNWLGKAKEQLKAVDGVSFNLKEGECLGIVGESGSGKTTLGKSILGLVELEGGGIVYRNQDITRLSAVDFRKVQPKLQMVFQDPFNSLNPKLKIDQLLREPLQVHRSELSKKEQDEHILDILHQVGLDETVLHRYPKAFSGGQRQRIGIARALLLQPEVLICDESVSALDVSVQAQVLNLIKSLQRKYGFSLVFISHDLSVIKFIADRILVMKEGKVVELAETEMLFASPKAAYTKELIGAILT